MSGIRCAVLGCALLGIAACGSDDDAGGQQAPNSLTQCASDKLQAAADYCDVLFDQDSTAADRTRARAELTAAWRAAETVATADGLSCADLALAAETTADLIDETWESITDSVVAAGVAANDPCVEDFVDEAGAMCSSVFSDESHYLTDILNGNAADNLARSREDARRRFLPRGDQALSACLSEDDAQPVSNAARASIDAVVDRVSFDTVAAPGVPGAEYITLSPTGSIQYDGRSLTPICMDGSDYHFFARRGTVNKLVMYYQGGGACWEKLTCGLPACDTNVDPERENPTNFSSGFADRNNPDNPFRDWHTVFVSYCGCDVHFGDAAQDYVAGPNDTAPLHVEHRGYQNARVVEKWAREHFIAPEEIFVTGSSAGAYGAWFHGPLLQWAWPWAQAHILADAGNGVITQDFLDNSFPNWNFRGNLPPEIPEIAEELDAGTGIVGYTKVITKEFPDANWAHYTTAFDGGRGGQTGFYNIMLNDNNPVAALTWWEGSCEFNSVMRDQAYETADSVPRNYRYYIGTGSRHTVWGSNKVYGVEDPDRLPMFQKITDDILLVDWVNAMLDSTPSRKSPDWVNFECEDCGLVLPGDAQPDPLEPPFEIRPVPEGDDEIVIVCD